MYAEVRETYPELNDKETEEYLAEEFRKWILSNGQYKKDLYSAETKQGFLARAFQKIKVILRSLLGLDAKFEVDPTMAVVANVFQSIESGKFSNFNAHASANQDAVANMALLPKVDAQYSQDIIARLLENLLRQ